MSRPIWAAKRRRNEIFIKNGSFENVPIYTGPTNLPTYWINGSSGSLNNNRYGWWLQSGAAGADARFCTTKPNIYSGGASMQLTISPGANGNTSTLNKDIAVTNYPGGSLIRGYAPQLKENTLYTFQFFMKTLYVSGTQATGNGACIQALVRYGTGGLAGGATIAGKNLTGSSSAYVTTTKDWDYYSGTFTTPIDTNGAGIFFTPKMCIFNTIGTPNDLVMTAWFDDLRLFEGAI